MQIKLDEITNVINKHVCWACGKHAVVNSCGMCTDCWRLYSPLTWEKCNK